MHAFGAAVFDVIEQEPARLREVTGIGAKRARRIVAGWADQKAIREIMLFLHANGVGTSRAVRIFKTYGQEAIALITDNPYRLARDIRGIGFRSADQVAAKLGIEKTAMIRVRAGLSFGLSEATGDGHCGLPVAELTRSTGELIEVETGIIQSALRLELQDGELVADTGRWTSYLLSSVGRAIQRLFRRLEWYAFSRSVKPSTVLASSRTLRAGCRRCRFAASWTTLARGALRGQVGTKGCRPQSNQGMAVAKTPQPVACHGRGRTSLAAGARRKRPREACQRRCAAPDRRSARALAGRRSGRGISGRSARPREPNGIRPDAVASERHSA